MYEYLTGLIRVLEKRLPDKTDLERMILAKTAKEAFDVLNDTDYADNLLDRAPESYLQVLEDDSQQLKELFSKMIGNSPLYNFLFIDSDFLNIKILLKQRLLNSQPVDNFDQFGLTPVKRIQKIIDLKCKLIKQRAKKKKTSAIELATGKVDAKLISVENKLQKIQIDEDLKYSLIKIIKKLKKGQALNPNIIDTVTDQELLKLKQHLAKKIKNNFIHNLLKLQIDFLNTKILLRSIREKGNKSFKFKKKNLINGGRIEPKSLIHLYQADQPVLFENLAELLEWYQIYQVIEEFKQKENLWQLERDLDKFEFDFVQTAARSTSSGPEVIVAYFLAKINGRRNVRMIMSGKLNKIEVEELKARVII